MIEASRTVVQEIFHARYVSIDCSSLANPANGVTGNALAVHVQKPRQDAITKAIFHWGNCKKSMIELKEEQRILLANLKRAVKEKVAPLAGETDKKGEFNWEVASLFWDLGILQIMLPEEYGGLAESPCYTLCRCIEEIAKACASSALLPLIQAVGSFPLILAGGAEQKNKYFPMISEQKKLMGYLVTEPGAGSDVANISTRADKKGGTFILNGRKSFATNGGVAGLYSVLAKIDGKAPSFFLVERHQKGVSIGKVEDKCGFRGSNTTEVILEDVEVPEENLLGNPGGGFALAMMVFDMSRPAVGALALGIAEGALGLALEYAKQRQTFGKPLINHQAIQFILTEAYTLIEAGRGLVERSARAFDAGQTNTVLSSMAKCFCSDAAMKITTDMVQVLGGYGYTKDYPLERMFRDAKLTQIFEGSNQIQHIIIGRELLKKGLADH